MGAFGQSPVARLYCCVTETKGVGKTQLSLLVNVTWERAEVHALRVCD